MPRRPRILPFALLFALCLGSSLPAEPSKVLVLANSRLKESVELANYYMQARQIPAGNLIHLSMPLDEDISWAEFSSSILNPLRGALLEKGFLDGRLHKEQDVFGRQKYSPLFNSAKYLVLCRGTPLRVANEIGKIPVAEQEKPLKIYRTTMGSVDGELALLPSRNLSPLAYMRNPLHNLRRIDPLTAEHILMVSRLDGPGHKACLRLVDSALSGEQGTYGRAYIDAGGPHQLGNDWMDAMARQLTQKGVPFSKDDQAALFHNGSRFDSPVLYFGWHKWHATGPFSRKDFRIPPGALHFHLHSFSARTLRSDRQNWVGPIVSHGAAGTIGNVSEPYLHLTHHLHLLQDALLSGKSLGEAAYFALPVLSWQAVLVGDPLYKPQINPAPEIPAIVLPFSPFHLEQYGALAKVLSLKQAGKEAEAKAYATAYLQKAYGLALALELAPSLGKDQAIFWLTKIANYEPTHFQEIPPMLLAANHLHQLGQTTLAKQILKTVEKSPYRPPEISWQELRF